MDRSVELQRQAHVEATVHWLSCRPSWTPFLPSGGSLSRLGIDVALLRLRRGYRREAHAAGFEEGSAIPWDEDSVYRLIDWLDQQATSHTAAGLQHLEKGGYLNAFSSIMAALLCDRDAMLVTYLWGSSQRSKGRGPQAGGLYPAWWAGGSAAAAAPTQRHEGRLVHGQESTLLQVSPGCSIGCRCMSIPMGSSSMWTAGSMSP